MKPVANLSILCANYNNGQYLEAFVRSVEASTMLPVELIVVDDGSTDNSLEVLQRFAYLPWLKVIPFAANQGFTTALNTALEAATGKYIMRADPDDLLLPDKIAVQWKYLEAKPAVDMLGTNILYFDDRTGKHLNHSNFPTSHHHIVQRYKNGEHGLLHATVCGKAEVYKQYRYQELSPGEDYELFARMARDGRVMANLREPLYLVRVHRGSSTTLLKYEAIARTFMFRDRIYGTKTSPIRIWCYYQHIRYYRLFQITDHWYLKPAALLLSILFAPVKLIRRINRLWKPF